MILVPQINNTPISGFFGFEKFGCGMFGVTIVGFPLIINASIGDVKAILQQTKKRPQELSVSVAIAGVDAVSNVLAVATKKRDGGPGSALLTIANIAPPAVQDTVVIGYGLTENGNKFVGTLFSGVVDSVSTSKQPGKMTIHDVVCRDIATGYGLQRAPATTMFTGSAHDLARIELAACGVVGILDFDDFDIYAGGPPAPGFRQWSNNPPFTPATFFPTVERLLLWMCSQTSYGNIFADASGAVHVASFTSARAVDHVYTAQGLLSSDIASAPEPLIPPQYGAQSFGGIFIGFTLAEARRPWPIGGSDYAAKAADYIAVTAARRAFYESLATATYHAIVMTMNPDIIIGHKITFSDQDGVTQTGIIRSVSHQGAWPAGFTTSATVAVIP